MNKTKKNYLFFFLIIFSVYSAISIGIAWDEAHLLKQGEITIKYLLSLGRLDEEIFRREYHSPIYYSLKYLFLQSFPAKYQIEANHLVNLFFSFGVIIGLKKLTKELFNESVSRIVFLILFFYPIFYGHMGFNSKDTIIALCHIWIFFLCFKYLKNQHVKEKTSNYVIYISLLTAVGSGINLYFLGSLLPLFVFLIMDFFFFKKIKSKKFNVKRFYADILKCFFIIYFLLVLFWIDTHPNIAVLPFTLFYEWLVHDFWKGFPYILFNGNYYLYEEIPKSYLIINILYKSPEYFLFTYIIFLFVLIASKNFFQSKFVNFNYFISLILLMLVFPFLLLYFTPFSIYDGLRHVLWMFPYACIIPGLTIYYLLKNLNTMWGKTISFFTSLLVIYFLFNFFTLTPYQYTYLNIFNGPVENRYQKFENDYWGSSIKELIGKVNFKKKSTIYFSTCGLNENDAENYLKRKGFSKFRFVDTSSSRYIIMTNRVTLDKENIYKTENLTNCFDKFPGQDVFKVERNGIVLSVIRIIN